MNFVEAISSGFNNYVTFSGRAQRSAYWWWVLFELIVLIVAQILDGILFGATTPVLYGIAALGLLLPSIAVAIRRLHDLDRTGWWFLLVFTGIGGIVLLIWFCMKGTTGPNRYGPDPLA
jgi:uncharacterized membrane protein YhaH (DUF805 family)